MFSYRYVGFLFALKGVLHTVCYTSRIKTIKVLILPVRPGSGSLELSLLCRMV